MFHLFLISCHWFIIGFHLIYIDVSIGFLLIFIISY